MNLKIWLFFLCAIITNLAMAEKCKPPLEKYCNFFSPDTTYVGVKVNFRKNIANQAVYLDGGCSIGIYKFFPKHLIKIDRQVKEQNITLNFTFCVNDKFINSQTIELNSDTKVICNVTDKLKCGKLKYD